MPSIPKPYIPRTVLTLLPFMLASCSDTIGLESGGGAGDTQIDAQAVALVAPFAGIYDLPDNWSGNPPDEAFLEIQPPNDQGVAVALLHDLDDINNCIPSRASEGEVTRELEELGDRVFMDGILDFSEAILSLQGTTLILSFPDANDLNNNSDISEFISLQAPRLGVMTLSDLGAGC